MQFLATGNKCSMFMQHSNQLLQWFNETSHLFFILPILSDSLWGHHYSTTSQRAVASKRIPYSLQPLILFDKGGA